MNRKRSAVLGALALAAPLVSVVSAPATAAPAQFCQENCYNSGYRYVLDQAVTQADLLDLALFDEPLEYFCSGPEKRELKDSLDADQAAASLGAAFALLSEDAVGVRISPRILTDNRARPVGIGFDLDLSPLPNGNRLGAAAVNGGGIPGPFEDLVGTEFQLVCFDDRSSVSPPA